MNKELPYVPVDHVYVEKVKVNLSMYKREKEFYCAAFFIIGQQEDTLRKQSKICAPLILYPARIIREGEFEYIRVDFDKWIININFLTAIKRDEVDDLYEVLREQIQPEMDDFGNVGKIKTLLESKTNDLDGADVLFYPELYSESKIKKLLQPSSLAKQDGYRLISAIAFGVFRRSNATQGIISELNLISKSVDLSASLRNVLGSNQDAKPISLMDGTVPAILSEAQQEIVSRVNKFRTTLVIGPPGTGKSFTIASIALDFLSKGLPVLIVSKTDQAVDVIQKKIEEDLQVPGVAFRAGKSDYKRQLKVLLKDLLSNTRRRPRRDDNDLRILRLKMQSIRAKLEELERQFKNQVKNELRWGNYLAERWDDKELFSRIKIRYIKWRNNLQMPHWELTRDFLELQNEYIDVSRSYLLLNFQTRIHKELYNNRAMFRDFLKSVTARTSTRQDLLFENINLRHLLRTFPIWLVNMSDIHDVFPLKKGVFSLAIIDEATQCDIASCLPILQRAERAMIVGDPKQLRHVSFLSRSVQQTLQKKNGIEPDNLDVGLDYRNSSILDMVDDRIENQEQISFLDEHYRSKPDIIKFSNEHFYADSLRIMTSIPYKDQLQNQHIVEANGIRDKQGVNRKEADLILAEIKKHIADQKELDVGLCESIGVLSPFRDQAEHIANLIGKEIPLEDIEKHNIRCGTAYSFQGEERDIMLLSFAIDQESHHSAIIHINKPDVFNVSITRARSKQIVFKSFPEQFDAGPYVSKFTSHIRNTEKAATFHRSDIKDQLLDEVGARLKERSIEFWPSHTVVGIEVDVIFKIDDKHYGIDLIGYPGEFEDALTIEDHKILGRAGVPVFPLPFTYWKMDGENCFNELLEFSKA